MYIIYVTPGIDLQFQRITILQRSTFESLCENQKFRWRTFYIDGLIKKNMVLLRDSIGMSLRKYQFL